MGTKGLDVGDQVPRGVRAQVRLWLGRVGRRAPATTLVEKHDAVRVRVEEAPHALGAAATRTSVQHDDRFAVGTSALLPVQTLAVTDVEHARVCLLYTSDAADDLLCVDLGGRR